MRVNKIEKGIDNMFFFIIDGATAMFLGGFYICWLCIKLCFKLIAWIFMFLPRLVTFTFKVTYYMLKALWICLKVALPILAILFGGLIALLDKLNVPSKIENTMSKLLNMVRDINIKNTNVKKALTITMAITMAISPLVFFASAVNDCMTLGLCSAMAWMISLISFILIVIKKYRK